MDMDMLKIKDENTNDGNLSNRNFIDPDILLGVVLETI